MPCPLYGFHLVPEMEVLIDQHGNECPLKPPFSPCVMEMAGQLPHLQNCALASTKFPLLALLRAKYTVVRRAYAARFPDWEQHHEERSNAHNAKPNEPAP